MLYVCVRKHRKGDANQIWLLLEEKLSAQPTDEVSRRVHLNFVKIVIAAWNVSFNDTLHAAVCFMISMMLHRHATSSTASGPPSPQGEGMCSRYFVAKSVSSRDGVTFIAKHCKSICGVQRRGTKPPPGGINGFNRVKDSGIGSEVYKAYRKPPDAGRFCPITIV